MYESMFGGKITWLLSTEIDYRYHIACLHLVIWTGLDESMILYFALSIYLRFSRPGCRRLLVRHRDSTLKLSPMALWTPG